jgi:flagellar hook assembly protein FlgD
MVLLEVSNFTVEPGFFSPNADGVSDTAEITYELSAGQTISTITILNSQNQVVRTLLSSVVQAAGSHQVSWDGRTDNNLVAAEGLYKIRLQALGKGAADRPLRPACFLAARTASIRPATRPTSTAAAASP